MLATELIPATMPWSNNRNDSVILVVKLWCWWLGSAVTATLYWPCNADAIAGAVLLLPLIVPTPAASFMPGMLSSCSADSGRDIMRIDICIGQISKFDKQLFIDRLFFESQNSYYINSQFPATLLVMEKAAHHNIPCLLSAVRKVLKLPIVAFWFRLTLITEHCVITWCHV